MDRKRNEKLTGGVFLIGIGVLAYTGDWWPGILVLLGVVSLVSGLLEQRLWKSASGALWLFGLALLFYFNFPWWILPVLAGVGLIIGAQRDRSSGQEIPEWAQRLTVWGARMQTQAEKAKRRDD